MRRAGLRNAGAPPLTVIVATTRCWPAADVCLRELAPQACAAGAELILCDGHGSGFDPIRYPEVVWLRSPGADRLTLHARALERARGDLVAITEDHVRPDQDWCEAVLRAHREQPHADIIVGAVRNASERRLSDRASFLLTSAPYLPPLQRLPGRTPPYNNLSMKRRVLPTLLAPGELEFDLVPGMFDAGQVVVDDRIAVNHVQPVSMAQALVMHFHNGRSHGGTFVDEPRSLRLRHARCALAVPRTLSAETNREITQRPASTYGRRDVAGVALIASAHTLGYLVGLVTGRGNSARHVI
jgi:hypothetical protein